MYENRSAAYWQLIQKLLECPSAKKLEILNAHFELVDPNFLQIIIVVAKQLSDNGNRNEVNFLTNLALKIGEFLGYDNQSISLRKQTADILLQWGIEQYYVSQLVAFQCWQQCLTIYQAVHDREGEAATLVNLGIAYASQGEYERVIDLQQQSLTIYREIGDRQGEAKSLGNLGNDYYFLTQYKEAFAFYEKSLAICREIGDRQGEAAALVNLGTAYNSLGQYELAIAKNEESLAVSREIGDRLGEASSLGNLGNACRYLRRFKEAISTNSL